VVDKIAIYVGGQLWGSAKVLKCGSAKVGELGEVLIPQSRDQSGDWRIAGVLKLEEKTKISNKNSVGVKC